MCVVHACRVCDLAAWAAGAAWAAWAALAAGRPERARDSACEMAQREGRRRARRRQLAWSLFGMYGPEIEKSRNREIASRAYE